MYYLIIALIILASLLMIGIVLIQESKGGGLASGFSSANQHMGVHKTTDFIEKGTWVLAISMVVLSVVSSAFLPEVKKTEVIESSMPINTATNAGNVQSMPTSGQQKPAAEAPAQHEGATNAAPQKK
jgi:preprotein translocase subunit SecG